MDFDLGKLLQQYLGAGANPGAGAGPAQAAEDFERVAQQAPRADLAGGVTQALRSEQTPPFAQMVGQLFGHGDPGQRAGMLNQLIASLGPRLLSGAAGGALAGMLGQGQQRVTPEQAAQLSPEQVRDIAAEAERQDPGLVERMGNFYSDHPTLVKALGGAALAIALGHMAQGMQRH